MADVFSIRKRSDVMSRIRSSGNKDTELTLVRLFRKARISGWRRCWPLIGKPDFVFREARLAVFVDGCFWHGCLKHSKPPRSNQTYWRAKMIRNKTRDLSVSRTLRKRDWRVLRIWEHELARKNEIRLLRRIQRALV
ncbi:MAG: very short patch repair endonuclease [Verrucomicrobia bacterium]|nr:very short patch repair endonuclease [Verrucomicrobiota bacterium]